MSLERHTPGEIIIAVHIAGEVVGDKQHCRLCGEVLIDFSAGYSRQDFDSLDWGDDVETCIFFTAGSFVRESREGDRIDLCHVTRDEVRASDWKMCQVARFKGSVEASLYV